MLTPVSASASSSSPSIAILGLGRMGSGMATRLHDGSRQVVGWSRSGRTPADTAVAHDPQRVVASADVVLLCLFDGDACRTVLDDIRDQLDGTKVVVNTSTVGIAEAVRLADIVRAAGAGYVHAPVIGSVPAVLAGTLTVLAGADAEYGDAVASVLNDLGDVLDCGTVANAAAVKLLANGVLGSALLTLRDSRIQADELGVEPDLAWTVLERTPLGRLVAAKRDQLEKRDFHPPTSPSARYRRTSSSWREPHRRRDRFATR